jgi:hypothetical protein
MSEQEWELEKMDRRNGWKRQERKLSATANLARVLGFTDHGDRCGAINLTREPSWMSMR